jgi:hypothetical protein
MAKGGSMNKVITIVAFVWATRLYERDPAHR